MTCSPCKPSPHVRSTRDTHPYLVSEAELTRLYERFKALDRDGSGTLSAEEILGVPEFAMNPLASRLVTLFLSDRLFPRDEEDTSENYFDREMNFREFVQVLAVFHRGTPVEEKLKFAFAVIDEHGNGEISGADLLSMLKAMVGQHVEDEQVAGIVTSIMEAATSDDTDGKKPRDRITFEDFCRVLERPVTDGLMSID